MAEMKIYETLECALEEIEEGKTIFESWSLIMIYQRTSHLPYEQQLIIFKKITEQVAKKQKKSMDTMEGNLVFLEKAGAVELANETKELMLLTKEHNAYIPKRLETIQNLQQQFQKNETYPVQKEKLYQLKTNTKGFCAGTGEGTGKIGPVKVEILENEKFVNMFHSFVLDPIALREDTKDTLYVLVRAHAGFYKNKSIYVPLEKIQEIE